MAITYTWNKKKLVADFFGNVQQIKFERKGVEDSYTELANGTGKPGIYILYSKPEQGVSVNAIPVRRIFCRPKPFCKL